MDSKDFQRWMLKTRIGVAEFSRITGMNERDVRGYLRGVKKIDDMLEMRIKEIGNAKK